MKYNKNTIDEILSSMNELDMGCCFIDRGRVKKHNDIWLDNDEDGNARFGQIQLKVDKSKVTVGYGDRLVKSEKNLVWKYEDYETIYELTDDIRKFSNEYFSSFEIHRVVGGKVIK